MLAQLSDPHIRLPPEDEGSGAAPAEYERVRKLLDPLPMPVHLLPGNHDDPAVIGADYAVVACPSTNLQARLEIGAEGFTTVREPPAFFVHALVDGALVSHVQPI